MNTAGVLACKIDWRRIVTALHKSKTRFVLTGLMVSPVWTGRPRSNHDIDILVSKRRFRLAATAIHATYPRLETRVLTGGVSFAVRGERWSVIDLFIAERGDLAAMLQTSILVVDGKARYRIPRLEPALANQYAGMRDCNRDAGLRLLDACEFTGMVRHSFDEGRDPIDIHWLKELGDLVWKGGGEEIVRFVEQAKAGEVPNPNA